LNPIGNFSHVTRSGNIVLKNEKDIPTMYAPVVARGKDWSKVIGKVSDIIGPVSEPYIIIKPKKGIDPNSLKNAAFFESERIQKKNKKKRFYRKTRGKGAAHKTGH
jgi:rRNA processing protein Gar1